MYVLFVNFFIKPVLLYINKKFLIYVYYLFLAIFYLFIYRSFPYSYIY